MSNLSVVDRPSTEAILRDYRPDVSRIVRDAYLLHDARSGLNPPSLVLKLPRGDGSRGIALPAYIEGNRAVFGLKWICSVPANVTRNTERASAVVVLNDDETGVPIGLLEASAISAARTAASAVVGAEALVGGRSVSRLGLVGCGLINRTIIDYLAAQEWEIDQVDVFDLRHEDSVSLAAYASASLGVRSSACACVRDVLHSSELLVLATTAPAPHIGREDGLGSDQVVLNISLRDLSPSLIIEAFNIVDDVDHCLSSQTSLHLAEQEYGTRNFIAGTLADLLCSRIDVDRSRRRIFSPFGLGVLDLALAAFVLQKATDAGSAQTIPNFLGDRARWD